jgi:hypothetical protein
MAGFMGIGHVRYSTAGGKGAVECQPFVAHTLHGQVALAHNGQVRFSTALFAQSFFSVAHLIFFLAAIIFVQCTRIALCAEAGTDDIACLSCSMVSRFRMRHPHFGTAGALFGGPVPMRGAHCG